MSFFDKIKNVVEEHKSLVRCVALLSSELAKSYHLIECCLLDHFVSSHYCGRVLTGFMRMVSILFVAFLTVLFLIDPA